MCVGPSPRDLPGPAPSLHFLSLQQHARACQALVGRGSAGRWDGAERHRVRVREGSKGGTGWPGALGGRTHRGQAAVAAALSEQTRPCLAPRALPPRCGGTGPAPKVARSHSLLVALLTHALLRGRQPQRCRHIQAQRLASRAQPGQKVLEGGLLLRRPCRRRRPGARQAGGLAGADLRAALQQLHHSFRLAGVQHEEGAPQQHMFLHREGSGASMLSRKPALKRTGWREASGRSRASARCPCSSKRRR